MVFGGRDEALLERRAGRARRPGGRALLPRVEGGGPSRSSIRPTSLLSPLQAPCSLHRSPGPALAWLYAFRPNAFMRGAGRAVGSFAMLYARPLPAQFKIGYSPISVSEEARQAWLTADGSAGAV